MSKLEVDAVEPQSGTSLTLGASGDTITIPSGAIISNQGTATGFGPTGAVSWDVANIKTTGFTAVNGLGYFCNTTSSAFTVTLPATPSAGNVIAISDYAATFATNNITINPNGNKIAGSTLNKLLNTNGIAVTLVYVDSTEGWIVTDSGLQGDLVPTSYSIDFLVVAGGGGGGESGDNSGGGAGGYRTSTQTISPGIAITVTVGDGGTSANGTNSSISGSSLTTITSAGGGKGGLNTGNGSTGGSGGGGGSTAGSNGLGGAGNTPSTSPSQGNNGGNSDINSPYPTGGGGGAGAVGGNASGAGAGGNGGNGTASSITGSSVTRAGGGGGGYYITGGTPGTGGTGGGGNAAATFGASGSNGTVNTGGGGGGGTGAGGFPASSGGKGVVILSLPIANYSNTTTGSPTVTESGSNKILVFNGSGSYTT
jgi:hypothetical protein